jgi:hypothetical protein
MANVRDEGGGGGGGSGSESPTVEQPGGARHVGHHSGRCAAARHSRLRGELRPLHPREGPVGMCVTFQRTESEGARSLSCRTLGRISFGRCGWWRFKTFARNFPTGLGRVLLFRAGGQRWGLSPQNFTLFEHVLVGLFVCLFLSFVLFTPTFFLGGGGGKGCQVAEV